MCSACTPQDGGLHAQWACVQVAHQQGQFLGKLFRKYQIDGDTGSVLPTMCLQSPSLVVGLQNHATAGQRDQVSVLRCALAELPEDAPSFKYKGFGSLAYIGHGAAVMDPEKSASVLGYIRQVDD